MNIKDFDLKSLKEQFIGEARTKLHEFGTPVMEGERNFRKNSDLVERKYTVSGYTILVRYHDETGFITSTKVVKQPDIIKSPVEGDFYVIRTKKDGKRVINFLGFVYRDGGDWVVTDVFHNNVSLDYAISKLRKDDRYEWLLKSYNKEKTHYPGMFGETTAQEVFSRNYLFGAEFVGKPLNAVNFTEITKNLPDGCYFAVDASEYYRTKSIVRE